MKTRKSELKVKKKKKYKESVKLSHALFDRGKKEKKNSRSFQTSINSFFLLFLFLFSSILQTPLANNLNSN